MSVRTGYGRNYLLPNGLAVPATERDEARMQHEQRTIAARMAKLAKQLLSEADRLGQVSVSLARAVGEKSSCSAGSTTAISRKPLPSHKLSARAIRNGYYFTSFSYVCFATDFSYIGEFRSPKQQGKRKARATS